MEAFLFLNAKSYFTFHNYVLLLPSFKNLREKSMANHKSALKRIRGNEAKRLRNKYQNKTARTYIKRLKNTTDKEKGEELLREVTSMIDKLAKKNIIHKNKAGNMKSKLTKHVAGLA